MIVETPDGKSRDIHRKIEFLNKELLEINKSFGLDDSRFNLSHFIGKAFITFRYQYYSAFCLNKSKDKPDYFTINNTALHIERPRKPNDVYWRNLEVSD